MTGPKIKAARVRYHRNGVMGEGFHTVEFTQGRGKAKQSMLGTLFEGRGRCAVIDLANPCEHWRGDDYEDALRQAVIDAGDSAYERP